MNGMYYLKIAVLPSDVREHNGINAKTESRYDGTSQTGDYPPFEAIKNKKGMIFFNLIDSNGTINSSDRRKSDKWLQYRGGDGNFSSIYTLELGTDYIIGFGNPSDEPNFKPKKIILKNGVVKYKERPNHFYDYRNDGYVFLIKTDWSEIEIFTVTNGKNVIQTVAKKIADGQIDNEITTLRNNAKPIFNY